MREQSPLVKDRVAMRLTLDLVPGAEPIAGVLRDSAGREREFSGWLGLAAALEVLAPGEAEPAKSPTAAGSP